MANATRTFKTYSTTDGGPLEATAITASNGSQFFDDDAIPASKVNLGEALLPTDMDSGVIGNATPTPAVGAVPFVVVVDLADGGTGNDIVTATTPRKGVLIDAQAIKAAANSAAGDKVFARTAAAGAGTKVFEADLEMAGPAALPDTTKAVVIRIDDSAATFASGASIFFGRTAAGGGNTAARVVLTFLPVD